MLPPVAHTEPTSGPHGECPRVCASAPKSGLFVRTGPPTDVPFARQAPSPPLRLRRRFQPSRTSCRANRKGAPSRTRQRSTCTAPAHLIQTAASVSGCASRAPRLPCRHRPAAAGSRTLPDTLSFLSRLEPVKTNSRLLRVPASSAGELRLAGGPDRPPGSLLPTSPSPLGQTGQFGDARGSSQPGQPAKGTRPYGHEGSAPSSRPDRRRFVRSCAPPPPCDPSTRKASPAKGTRLLLRERDGRTGNNRPQLHRHPLDGAPHKSLYSCD